jgi:hypothetical protein
MKSPIRREADEETLERAAFKTQLKELMSFIKDNADNHEWTVGSARGNGVYQVKSKTNIGSVSFRNLQTAMGAELRSEGLDGMRFHLDTGWKVQMLCRTLEIETRSPLPNNTKLKEGAPLVIKWERVQDTYNERGDFLGQYGSVTFWLSFTFELEERLKLHTTDPNERSSSQQEGGGSEIEGALKEITGDLTHLFPLAPPSNSD